MHIKNFEFKAKVVDIKQYEEKLLSLNPKFIGIDNQLDTYFNVEKGRLKLREGNIENALINYDRNDIQDSKESQIILYKHEPNIALKNILEKQLGIKVIVNKKRKIYFIDNIKFHFDKVENLGDFIEVEAIDENNEFGIEELKNQCNKYLKFFELEKENLVEKSYSDLILERK